MALDKENQLWMILRVTKQHESIRGVKVIGAREGSVILDLLITHSNDITHTKASGKIEGNISFCGLGGREG